MPGAFHPDVTVVQVLMLLTSIASCTAAWVAVNRSRAKDLLDRVSKMEAAMIASGVKIEAGEALQARMLGVEERMTRVETTLQHVASAADVRALQQDIANINRTVGNVQESTRRIENWLVESGR